MRYKLTTQDMKTRHRKPNEVTWEVGKWVEAAGDVGGSLCSDAYIHWYEGSPELAILLNPIHAHIEEPRCWEVECGGRESRDGGLKGGSRRVRLVREVPVPEITTEHRARFAILCAKAACNNPVWNQWADKWLSGEDRSVGAAEAAAWATRVAVASAAAARVAEAAVWAARAASWAAAAASWAAEAAAAAAWAASWAAEAATRAAEAASWAARATRVEEAENIDLVEIARRAVYGD